MFTGLIEQVGSIREVARVDAGWRFVMTHEPWADPLAMGESVAVQGACLTVAAVGNGSFACDVLEETVAVTTLRSAPVGRRVNLERALALGGRLGGHLVTGHVDGQGRVNAIRRAGRDWVLAIGCDAALLAGVVSKGSIAVDGVSLTVSRVLDSAFEVNIIPHTWTHTTLDGLRVGDTLNLETDLIGKYVTRFLAGRFGNRETVTLASLEAAGIV